MRWLNNFLKLNEQKSSRAVPDEKNMRVFEGKVLSFCGGGGGGCFSMHVPDFPENLIL